ncbi:hypothetical protein BJ085DRAFT_39276, partial [Dimargaris cristalligena]
MSKFSKLSSGLPVPSGLPPPTSSNSRSESPRAPRKSLSHFTPVGDNYSLAMPPPSRISTGSLPPPFQPTTGLHRRMSSISSVTDADSQPSASSSPPSLLPAYANSAAKPPNPRSSLLSPSPTGAPSGLLPMSSIRKSTTFSPALTQPNSRGIIPAFRKLSLGKPPTGVVDEFQPALPPLPPSYTASPGLSIPAPTSYAGQSSTPLDGDITPRREVPMDDALPSPITPVTLPPASGRPHLSSERPTSPAVLSQKFAVEDPITVPSMGLSGTLKFIGPAKFKPGIWAGIQLDTDGAGKNDGTVGGVRYFDCPPNCGIFVLAQKLARFGDTDSMALKSTDSTPGIGLVTPGPPTSGIQRPTPGGLLLPTPSKLGPRLGKGTNGSAINLRKYGRPTPNPNDRSLPSPGPVGAGLPPTRPNGLAPPSVSRSSSGRRMTIGPTANVRNARTSPVSRHDPQAMSTRARSPSAPQRTAGLSTRGLANGNLANSARSAALANTGSAPVRRTPLGPGSRPTVMSDSRLTGRWRDTLANPRKPPAKLAAEAGKSSGTATPRNPPPVDANQSPSLSPAIPVELFQRVKLKLEMLEAENKVLRLENKQGRAQLEARQLVEKDLIRKQVLEEIGASKNTPNGGDHGLASAKSQRTESDESTQPGTPPGQESPLLKRSQAVGQAMWPASVAGTPSRNDGEALPSIGDRIAKLSQKFASIDSSPGRRDSSQSDSSSQFSLERKQSTSNIKPEGHEDNLNDEILQLTEVIQNKEKTIKDLETQLAERRAASPSSPGGTSKKLSLDQAQTEIEQLRRDMSQLHAQLEAAEQTRQLAELAHLEERQKFEAQLSDERADAQKSVQVIEELKAVLAENEKIVVQQKEDIQALIRQMDILVGKALHAMQVIREMDWAEDSQATLTGTRGEGPARTADHAPFTAVSAESDDLVSLQQEQSEQVSRALDSTAQAVERLQKVNHRLSMDLHSVLQERALSPSDGTAVSVAPVSSRSTPPPMANGTSAIVHGSPFGNDGNTHTIDAEERYRQLVAENEVLQAQCEELKIDLRQKEDLVASLYRKKHAAAGLEGRSPYSPGSFLGTVSNSSQADLEFDFALNGSQESLRRPGGCDEAIHPTALKNPLHPALNDSLKELHMLVSEAEVDQIDVSNEILGEEVLRLRETSTELQQRLEDALAEKATIQSRVEAAEAKLAQCIKDLEGAQQRYEAQSGELEAAQDAIAAQASQIDQLKNPSSRGRASDSTASSAEAETVAAATAVAQLRREVDDLRNLMAAKDNQ